MPLDRADFQYVQQLVRERSGIVLDEGKEYLIETRLTPVARAHGKGSIAELIAAVRAQRRGPLEQAVVEAMTTNETSFFRDIHPFEALRREIFPALIKARAATRKLDIWCAAASSGQEPYSISMMIRENFPQLATWNVRILATDISREILTRAKAGVYSQLEVNRGLPAPLLVKYFQKDGLSWVLKDDIRKMVDYREMNLTEAFPPMQPFDLIMIRNVLIYFDLDTKREILRKLGRLLKPDAHLFLGGAETTVNIDDSYGRVTYGKTVCYQMKSASVAGAAGR